MRNWFEKRQIPLIYLLLAVATVIVYWRVNGCDFTYLDDLEYVTENRHIQNGLTLSAVHWAFTTGHAANWHPLTWMSHMLDIQLFGLNPHLHHLTNLLFHIANTLLLFLVFHRMTRAPWRSGYVAALFALHPLHVESVAWVAERKDVLSTFFWMLTMAAYVRYVEGRRLKNYLAVLILFALGLMAKPMLVTLPFVLLLLDYWPLRRLLLAGGAENGARGERFSPGVEPNSTSTDKEKKKSRKKLVNQPRTSVTSRRPSAPRPPYSVFRSLLMEKTPLFVLTALSCIITYMVQLKGQAVQSIETFPLSARISNVFISYLAYMRKTIWPDDLAFYYPHPGSWPLWQVLGSALLFAAITFVVIRAAKRYPYLPFGWFWYAGTLVPVIGIVQVGRQAMAIGILIFH